MSAVEGAAPPVPVTKISADKLTGNAPLMVKFTDQFTGPVTSWVWNFKDGQTSTAQHPTHIFQNAGNYDVSMAVTGSGGSSNVIVRITVTQSIPPTNGVNPVYLPFIRR